MRKQVLSLLSALAFCLAPLTSLAINDIEPGKEFYTVVYAPNPIVLDGDLSEWSGVPVIADPKSAIPKFSGTNANPNYVLFEEFNGGTWSGPDDQTSAVQIVYDADNVYLGVVVTDDYHEDVSGNAWDGDSIQLFIADAARTNQVALYNYALGGYENASGTLVTNDPTGVPYGLLIDHQAGPGGDTACNCPTEAVIKRDFARKKTTYEIKLPKGALGLTTLKGGPQFGLGMAINDGDGVFLDLDGDGTKETPYGQGAGQEGQKGWGGLGAHSIVHGKTASETALMTLVKGNDIEPGKEYYTALRTTNAIVLDGNLSEWSGAPVIADPKSAIPKFSGTNANPNYILFEEFNGGTWSGPDDQTSAVQIVYDADNVYIGVVVTDDYHEDVSGNAWDGDSIQLAIADAARTNLVALYNYALGGYENAAGTLVTNDPTGVPYGLLIDHEQGPGGDMTCNCPTAAFIKRDFAKKKTYYEIKLPVASLGLTGPLTVGTQFGLGMAINDGDGVALDLDGDGIKETSYGQGAGQEGQKGWGGLGAHSIVHGKTASETALVTLGTTVAGADRPFLSVINPNFDSFTFRANDKGASIVDPASAKLTIDGQVVPLTAGPKSVDATDFSYKPAAPFPPNSDHTYSIEVKDTLGNTVTAAGSFKTINYTLDKLHSYFGQIRGSAALTPPSGGHTGQTSDLAVDFGRAGSINPSVLIPDGTFMNPTASNDVMTFSLWIKKYDNDIDNTAFWADSPSSPGILGFKANVPLLDGTIVFDAGGNVLDDSEISAPIASFPAFTDDAWWTNLWHHWVFVKNGLATKQIWIDGQLFLEGTAGATPLPRDFAHIWLGADASGQGGITGNLHGLIDDFAIFGTALTQAQIQQLFTGTLPSALPASTKPLAYWDFSASAVVVRPPITVGRSGNAITISWPGSVTGFRLVTSATVNGTYTDVTGVTGNSYTINSPTGTKFYYLIK